MSMFLISVEESHVWFWNSNTAMFSKAGFRLTSFFCWCIQVIVMGATNRPQDLDSAIMRRMPTRFHINQPVSRARFAWTVCLVAELQAGALSARKCTFRSLVLFFFFQRNTVLFWFGFSFLEAHIELCFLRRSCSQKSWFFGSFIWNNSMCSESFPPIFFICKSGVA